MQSNTSGGRAQKPLLARRLMRVTHLFAGPSGRRRRSAAAQGVRLPDPAPNRAAPAEDEKDRAPCSLTAPDAGAIDCLCHPMAHERRATAPLTDQARLRQQALGDALRQALERVVNAPVPRDFLQILRRADRSAARLSPSRAAPSHGAFTVGFGGQAAATTTDDLADARAQGGRVAGPASALRAWS